MNERIKELAELAKFAIYVSNDPNSPPSWRAAGHNECFEKFAELIVKECANFISEGKFGDKGTAKKLIEHFGVDWSKCRTAIGINSIHNACMFRADCRKADAEIARLRRGHEMKIELTPAVIECLKRGLNCWPQQNFADGAEIREILEKAEEVKLRIVEDV